MNLPHHAKARFWARIFIHCPGVVGIFLSGSLATGDAKQSSDIDFFILTREGQIWTARLWVFLVLKLTRNLSKKNNHEQKICPNHFITHQHLEIREKDPYAAYLFAHNIPLADPYNLWTTFQKENSWISDFGETWHSPAQGQARAIRSAYTFERWIEYCLRTPQAHKIKHSAAYHSPRAKIILTDTELRFHPDPKNQYFKPKR